MKRIASVALAAAALSFAPMTTAANADDSMQTGGFVGFAFDASDPVFGAELGWIIPHQAGESFFGPEFVYLRDTETVNGVRGTANLYSFLGSYRYYIYPAVEQATKWYVGGGLGATRGSVRIRGFGGDSDTFFTWHVGAGAEFGLADNVNLRLGLRYIDHRDIDMFGTTFDYDDLIAELGLNLRF